MLATTVMFSSDPQTTPHNIMTSLRSTNVFLSLLIGGLLVLSGCDSGGYLGSEASSTPEVGAETAANNGSGPQSAAQNRAANVFRADLASLNGSGVQGVAKIQVQNGTFTVQINARGHVPGRVHPQHIHAKQDGSKSTCPPASADDDGDGLVSVTEGGPFYGPVFIPLDGSLEKAEGLGEIKTFPVPNNQGGAITYRQSISLEELGTNFNAPLNLDQRAIVLHGENVGGEYIPTLPVACGTIERVN